MFFVHPNYANAQDTALEATGFSFLSATQDNKDTNQVDATKDIVTTDKELVPTMSNPGTIDGIDDGTALSDQMDVYVVGEGDSMSKIAETFGISENTILLANKMKKGDKLTEGDVLIILPTDGVLETVAKGATLETIAKKYKVDVADIVWYNDIPTEDTALTEGQQLIIPGAEVQTPIGTTGAITKKKVYPNANLKTVAGYFAYPVKLGGPVRKTQGLHAGGRAIDFGAPERTPVYAAADGVIILAKGNNAYNGGFGNYIIISHPNGTQTLYAHLSSVMTSVGSKVSQGQVIGLSGGKRGAPGAGKTTGPHLHFEVLKAKNPF